jgi:hypothetical protein
MYERFEAPDDPMSNGETTHTSHGDRPVNWRRTDSGITLYEADNPDAWIRAEFEAGVDPEHRLFMVCGECGAVFPQRSKPGNGTVCGDCGTTFDHSDDG